MPPELQGDVALVKTEAIRISMHLSVSGPFFKGPSSTGGKAPSLKPYAVKGHRVQPEEGGIESVRLLGVQRPVWIPFGEDRAELLVPPREQGRPGGCSGGGPMRWGLASSTGSASTGKWGLEMRVPQGNSMAWEVRMRRTSTRGGFFFRVGPPSELIPPEFPSGGGGLIRGEVRYEATSTNAAPLGLKSAMISATFFTKEGRAVAAVERLVPGRVLMQCSIPPAEQPIFVAIGAALYIRDGQASSFEY